MSQKEEIPEGQRPDEDWLAYMERVNPEMFESLKYLAEAASLKPNQEVKIQNNKTEKPDIRRIEKSRNNLSFQEREHMMKMIKTAFLEYFSEDFVDEDTEE